MLSTYFY